MDSKVNDLIVRTHYGLDAKLIAQIGATNLFMPSLAVDLYIYRFTWAPNFYGMLK